MDRSPPPATRELQRELISRFAPGCIRPQDTLQMEPFTHAELTAVYEALRFASSAVAVDSPQTWVAAEKAKLDAYEDAARSVEKLAEDYTHEHGSYDGSTNAWELHHRHAEYIEALDAAVEAIRKRKAEKCHITKAKAL